MPRITSRSFLKDNGLTLAMMALFVVSWIGQMWTGWNAHNEGLRQHHATLLTFWQYLQSGDFIESTFENWESEFLQMMIFVVLSAYLYQRGSAESNPLPDEEHSQPHYAKLYFAQQRLLRRVYENSLSLALLLLFTLSFMGHAYGGWLAENAQRRLTDDSPQSLWQFVSGSDFWFQSFQNWQSEFLSIAVITYLSIFLRQKGSAQSKQVDAPHSRTEG
ncbi:MAG: hypothetical protein KF799_09600 [Bdellovibrionales bacterium]|nr:hypothetical protein [Bdellovibrionales bacterium]